MFKHASPHNSFSRERPENLDARHTVPRHLSYPLIPAWGLLDRAAKLCPDRRAYVYYDQAATFREADCDAARASALLKQLGVRPGDRVGILLPNVPEYMIALNGIWRAGAIAPDFKFPEVTPRFADEASKVIESHDGKKPLFLYLALPSPHTPWLPCAL